MPPISRLIPVFPAVPDTRGDSVKIPQPHRVPKVSAPAYPRLALAISGSSSAITGTSSPCSMRSRYSSTAATPCLQSCPTGQVQMELSFPFSRETSVKYSIVPCTRATRLPSGGAFNLFYSFLFLVLHPFCSGLPSCPILEITPPKFLEGVGIFAF